MHIVSDRTAMLPHMTNETTQSQRLANITRSWDGGIHRELRRFAQYIWPDIHLLGLIPRHSYRLRKRLESEKSSWWVERDTLPIDHYRCEAYRVELSINGTGQPRMVVRSGITTYPVIPLSMEGLKTALMQAGVDMPLVIPRQFGPALDP